MQKQERRLWSSREGFRVALINDWDGEVEEGVQAKNVNQRGISSWGGGGCCHKKQRHL